MKNYNEYHMLTWMDAGDIELERDNDNYYLILNSSSDYRKLPISKETYQGLLNDYKNWSEEEDE